MRGFALFVRKSLRYSRALTSLALALPLAGCFIQQASVDAEMRRLCAIDGGVRSYELVKLPPEQLDAHGFVKGFDRRTGRIQVGPGYTLTSDDFYYRRGNPDLLRVQYTVNRNSDGKLMGESISYIRRGGDMLPLDNPSGIICPSTAGPEPATLLKKIFTLGENNRQ